MTRWKGCLAGFRIFFPITASLFVLFSSSHVFTMLVMFANLFRFIVCSFCLFVPSFLAMILYCSEAMKKGPLYPQGLGVGLGQGQKRKRDPRGVSLVREEEKEERDLK